MQKAHAAAAAPSKAEAQEEQQQHEQEAPDTLDDVILIELLPKKRAHGRSVNNKGKQEEEKDKVCWLIDWSGRSIPLIRHTCMMMQATQNPPQAPSSLADAEVIVIETTTITKTNTTATASPSPKPAAAPAPKPAEPKQPKPIDVVLPSKSASPCLRLVHRASLLPTSKDDSVAAPWPGLPPSIPLSPHDNFIHSAAYMVAAHRMRV